MRTVRQYLLNLALTLLILVGAAGAAVSGTILYDLRTDGKVTAYFEDGIEYSAVRTQDEIIDEVVSLLNKEKFNQLKQYAGEVGIEYYVSSVTGTPIARSRNWYVSIGKAAIYKYEKLPDLKQPYKLQVIFLEKVLDEKYIYVAKLWESLSFLQKWSAGLFTFSVALIVFSVLMLHLYAGPIFKAFLFLVSLGVIQIGAVFVTRQVDAKKIAICIACEKLLLFVIACYYIGKLKQVHQKIESISHPEDRKDLKKSRFPRSMRKLAADVDAAEKSITVAVNERLKSDRLKTELISNVSHDLKTPLTSVINFSDLISKEPTENKAITEYADHLHRQSIRLKDLMDALIEASKASSGAIEMNLVPCKVKTLLEQSIVEYEEKLEQNGITLIDLPADESLMILADVKALCRIFENLLNNICKYALPNSRAYLEVKQEGDMVGIAFKNISAEAINLSADELTERFVRGDVSRHSEGYGLGLSIVKSLMDLMNGKMEFSAEYDMFVVKLLFPESKDEGLNDYE